MNIYKVTLDKNGYDEYDSFVVYATCASSAEDMIYDEVNPSRCEHWQQVDEVELLGHTENCDLYPTSGIILGSFNAG